MTSSAPCPAITAMWVLDNPVDPAADPRGRGYAPAAAERLAAFARAGGLREVFLAAPCGPPGGGPVDDWFAQAVAALHDAGVRVSAVAAPDEAGTQWPAAAAALAPIDRFQVAVEPWAGPTPGRTPAELGREVVAAVAAVAARTAGATGAPRTAGTAGAGVPVDVCLPWWLATEPVGDGRTLLEEVIDVADRVVLAAPGAHAAGPGGVLDLAAPAVAALAAAGRPFFVGVETDSPDAAGGPDRTFWESGPVAMVRECGLVAAELARVPGFEGVAVRSHRAWRRLLGV